MEKEQVMLQYNLFRIPECEKETVKGNKQVVIGLIDASGSMSSYWKEMVTFWNKSIAPQCQFLITFSQVAKLEENPILSEDLSKHGGGSTNILAAFQTLQTRLESLPNNLSLTVVFISDGQDTVSGGKIVDRLAKLKGSLGRSINFICLGIQSGFPTNLAMKLRELYHTGDQAIPAVYLIQYASQKAFFNKFQTMANCFKSIRSIQIPFAGKFVKEYPWQQAGESEFKEGKWVMVHKQFPVIDVKYDEQTTNKFKVTTLEEMSIDDLVDCFRGWVQKIQVLSMDQKNMGETQKKSQLAVDLIKSYVHQYEKMFNLEIINEKIKEGKDSFKKRAASLVAKNIGGRLKWFVDELMVIAKGLGIGQLNEYDAAKRLGIGTITGKYHQKALALKGITMKDFTIIKEQFSDVFKKTQLKPEPSKQDVSIFTLQNQKEIFQQPDFLEGLEYCKSQFDLVESFPVVGYGLKVKRHDGSMINPWKVRVLSLAKTHKTIDSMYLAKNSNKYQLSIGEGRVEEINAVLPLFGLQDGQMSNLLNTRLFKLAVSFMVVQNIDTYHSEAYMALLGSTFMFLMKQPTSVWRTEMLEQIYTSMKITYGATQDFNKLITKIEENPYELFMAKADEDHIDIVKVFLLTYYIYKQGRLNKQKMQQLIDLAIVHYCQKTYVENEFKIYKIVDVKLNSKELPIKKDKKEKHKKGQKHQKQQKHQKKQKQQKDKKQQEIQQKKPFNYDNTKYAGKQNMIKDHQSLKAVVEGQLKNVINLNDIKLQLNDKIFRHEDEERRVCFSHVNKFFESFYKRPFQENQILYYFGHYLNGKTKQNYNKPINKSIEELEKTVAIKIDMKDLGKGQTKQTKLLRKHIENELLQHFRHTHFGILPMDQAKLEEICKEKNLNSKNYILNPNNGLLKNTCMSPKCIYYMMAMTQKDAKEHLKLWRHKIPARFHLTVVNGLKAKKTPQKICEQIMKSNLVNEKRHQANKQFVLNYIIDIAKNLDK